MNPEETNKTDVSATSTPVVPAPAPVVPTYITIDDVKKVEITVGRILSAEKVEGSEKLLKLSVDFAEATPRQVISGIGKQYPDPAVLVGKLHPFVTNLQPRIIMGLESQAMIFAASAEAGLALMSPTIDVPPGTRLS